MNYLLIKKLKEFNIDVLAVVDSNFRGISDRKLVEIANRDKRIIVTKDRDFTQKALLNKIKSGVINIYCGTNN